MLFPSCFKVLRQSRMIITDELGEDPGTNYQVFVRKWAFFPFSKTFFFIYKKIKKPN